jgi:Rad3-related DNA helicase
LIKDIAPHGNQSFPQIIDFTKQFLAKEKGRTIIILNSNAKLEQFHTVLAPQLKKENLTLLATHGTGGLGKILEMYKKSPETTTIVLTPNKWESFNLNEIPEENDFKNLIIHQIPFAPPSDPFLIAMSKSFKDPWGEFQIGTAALSLKKMVGKFLSKTSGKIVILDNRITQKNYTGSFTPVLEEFTKPTEYTTTEFLRIL